MLRKATLLLLVVQFLYNGVPAQQSETIRNYINTYKDLAMAEMKRTGVPASIKLAQGIHETLAGTSALVMKSNNHFGIKCKTGWTGESVSHDDDARGECFRKYPTAEDSYRDHSNFLKNSQRYAGLFQLDPTDYSGWANGLKKAGYATNPKYPQVLIRLIEDYNLQEYTLLALGKAPDSNTEVEKTVETDNGSVKVPVKEPETTVAPAVAVNYPKGEFKINETRVVFVKKGVSFLSLAQQYDIPLSRIFDFNELPVTEVLTSDQLIFLQRKRKTGQDEYYKVLPGETLYDIAQKQGMRLESLRELNSLGPDDRPAPGESLTLRKKAVSTHKLLDL
jgi:LysM repeat protein